MEKLSLDVSEDNFSRDLLQRFGGNGSEYELAKEENEEIELNLGLSLGGRFGADKSSKKLARSSSVAGWFNDARGGSDSKPVGSTGLVRTSSLPVETEEDWRKRKELQTLRRMEAKRRRSEKQRSVKGNGDSGNSSLEGRKEIRIHSREKSERATCFEEVKKLGLSLEPVRQFGLPLRGGASARWAIHRGGMILDMPKGKETYLGSVESRGGSSSGLSDVEGNPPQGSSRELSPAEIQSLKLTNQDVNSSPTKSEEKTSETTRGNTLCKKSDTSRTRGSSSLEDMPCVFTVGNGPHGRRVDGILYKYAKGAEVRIMCVCCGDFHSPAEFVKHAGGTDVVHPLKHIVINPLLPLLR